LKADLLRLAALLHVEIAPKDTIEVIKEKIKPTLEAMKPTLEKPKAMPKAKSGSIPIHTPAEPGTPSIGVVTSVENSSL